MNILRIKEPDTIYIIKKFPILIVTKLKHTTGWFRYDVDGNKINRDDTKTYGCYILYPIDNTNCTARTTENVEVRIYCESLQLARDNGKFN